MQEYKVTIDSDYVGFIPGKTRLKYSTVVGHRPLFIILMPVLLAILIGVTGFELVRLVRHIEMELPNSTARRAVEARIERCTITTGKYSPEIIVTYNYVFRDQSYSSSSRLTPDTCDSYSRGRYISVLVYAPDPTFTRLNEQKSETFNIGVVTVLLLGLTGYCAWSVARFFPSWRRWRRLSGPQAQLIEGWITRNVHEIDYSWHVFATEYPSVTIEYRFHNPNGQELKGQIQTSDSQEMVLFTQMRPGTKVTILYADDKSFVLL